MSHSAPASIPDSDAGFAGGDLRKRKPGSQRSLPDERQGDGNRLGHRHGRISRRTADLRFRSLARSVLRENFPLSHIDAADVVSTTTSADWSVRFQRGRPCGVRESCLGLADARCHRVGRHGRVAGAAAADPVAAADRQRLESDFSRTHQPRRDVGNRNPEGLPGGRRAFRRIDARPICVASRRSCCSVGARFSRR